MWLLPAHLGPQHHHLQPLYPAAVPDLLLPFPLLLPSSCTNAQGLLCGYSLLILALNITIYSRSTLQQYLTYYSPAAVTFSRIFFTLTTLSTIAATARRVKEE